MPAESAVGPEGYGITKSIEGLPELREEDLEHFGSLLQVRLLWLDVLVWRIVFGAFD